MKSDVEMLSCGKAVGRGRGGGRSRKGLGFLPEQSTAIEHGYIEDHTTTWGNVYDVILGEECRIQGATQGMSKAT